MAEGMTPGIDTPKPKPETYLSCATMTDYYKHSLDKTAQVQTVPMAPGAAVTKAVSRPQPHSRKQTELPGPQSCPQGDHSHQHHGHPCPTRPPWEGVSPTPEQPISMRWDQHRPLSSRYNSLVAELHCPGAVKSSPSASILVLPSQDPHHVH